MVTPHNFTTLCLSLLYVQSIFVFIYLVLHRLTCKEKHSQTEGRVLIIIIIILGTQSIHSRVSSASTAEKNPNDHGRGMWEEGMKYMLAFGMLVHMNLYRTRVLKANSTSFGWSSLSILWLADSWSPQNQDVDKIYLG